MFYQVRFSLPTSVRHIILVNSTLNRIYTNLMLNCNSLRIKPWFLRSPILDKLTRHNLLNCRFLVGDTKSLRIHNFTSRTKRLRKSYVSKIKIKIKSSVSTVSVSWQIVRRWCVFNRGVFIAKGDLAWRYYKGSSLVALADWIRDTFLMKEPQEMRCGCGRETEAQSSEAGISCMRR